ncbi:rhomboid family intramembrane serine protease [Sulfitobacter sp. D35]|uniref:rhomboid family intramembrane serine protease n=1 Tax=Sulfitobacter sp. D35 TaxID=3083252 RepID=UPI00296E72F6|nr:rhomboid family intramembrane serine protease [Sulfitobacter sp. D35]MDW4496646.1 rhomboid family intramembrane serine protease [Sulfitobacter sp. D35]
MRDRFTSVSLSRDSQYGAPAFLWWLVGIMAAIELILAASDAGLLGLSGLRWVAFRFGAFWEPLLAGTLAPLFPGQTVTMFVTHAFLHGGLMHLLLNGVVLLALGKTVSARIGPARTLAVLLVSAVAGGAAFGLISTSTWPMIGASGAVFGLFGVWQAWQYEVSRRTGRPLQPVVNSVLALVVANILLAVVLSGGLAWEAHLGGWLAGCAAAMTFARA